MEEKEKMKVELAEKVLPSILSSKLDEDAMKRVIDYFFEKIDGVIKNPEEQVWFGDLVTLSIDGGCYEEYFISGSRWAPKLSFGSEYNGELQYYHDEIYWDSALGHAIINSYIGDTVQYYDGDGDHIVQIIDTIRTEHSEKINNTSAEESRILNKKIKMMEQRQKFDEVFPQYIEQKIAALRQEIVSQQYRELLFMNDQINDANGFHFGP